MQKLDRDVWGINNNITTCLPVYPSVRLSCRWCTKTPDILLFYYFFFSFFFITYFPAQLVGGFTLSDLLDKPWSRVASLPPGTCLQFLSRTGFSIPTARRFSSNVANSRSRAFRSSFFFCARKSPYEYMHSVRIELAKLILVGTRITYQATGRRLTAVVWH